MIEGNWQVEVRIFVDPGEPFFSKTCFEERSAAAFARSGSWHFYPCPISGLYGSHVFLTVRFVAFVALVSAGGSLAGKLSSRLSVRSSSTFSWLAAFCSF